MTSRTSDPDKRAGLSGAPRVSVIIATYNRASMLAPSVASLQRQTLEDLEIVLVDDASSDETPQVLEQLRREDRRIRPVRAPHNLGPGGARNLGAREARASLVAMLDDDDLSAPHRLATQADYLDNHPHVDALFSAMRWIDASGQTLRHVTGPILKDALPRRPKDMFELLYLDSNKLTSTTLMIRRAVLLETPYATDVRVGEDWSMFLRLAARGKVIASIPELLVDVLRDAEHDSLMAQKERAFADQKRVLLATKDWLRREGIRDFDHLHRRAWARQLIREARYWYGTRACSLIARAVLAAPGDAQSWRAVAWLGGVATQKIKRRLTGGAA